MPPKKAKPFSSRFASSDEEEEQEDNADNQAPTKAPRRKTKATASRDPAKPTAKQPPPPHDNGDDEEKESPEEEEEVQKPAASRRGRGGGRGRGSRNATGTTRGGKAGSTATAKPATAKAKEKPNARKAGTSRTASKAVVEQNDNKGDDSDTHLPDAQEDEEEEEEEGEGGDGVVDDSIDESAIHEAPAVALKGTSKGNSASHKHVSESSDLDPREAQPAGNSSLKMRDINSEFEKLSLKYNKLLALRSTEAESALGSFKENMKQKDIASERLIGALTSEVNAASELSAKSRELQNEAKRTTALLQEKEKQLTAQKMACERLQRENEHLLAKLSSGRNQGPGGHGGKGGQPTTFRELSSLKEELYGDLSGLIIRRIQDDNEGLIVYDCLQTGRNGTLRFKLSVSSAALSNRSDGYNSADSEITYKPLLDPQDKLLENVLPTYLKEEITFPREKASSFYLRLANALQNAQVSS